MMPLRVVKRGLHHTLLTVMFIGSIFAIHAAEVEAVVNTFSGEAETWGLWPVLAISVVVASMAYAWQLSRGKVALADRIIMAYEGVLRDAIGSNDDLGEEIRSLKHEMRGHPCGKNLPDSGADRSEETPARAARTVARRAARHERNHGGET
jgi:hypothetical protein